MSGKWTQAWGQGQVVFVVKGIEYVGIGVVELVKSLTRVQV